jgi:hypothetical protein
MSDRDHDPPSHDEPTPGERDGEAKRPSPAPGKTSRVERYYGMIQRRHLDGPRDLEPRLTAVSGSAMPDDLFDAFALHLDPVQREAEFAGLTALDPMVVHAQAARGLTGAPTALPHGDAIQRSFGPDHDVSSIRAHVGGPAAEASTAIGARAYATGDSVAFASAPDLHTAAHEAAHIVQQRAGVQLYGGVGQAGDRLRTTRRRRRRPRRPRRVRRRPPRRRTQRRPSHRRHPAQGRQRGRGKRPRHAHAHRLRPRRADRGGHRRARDRQGQG